MTKNKPEKIKYAKRVSENLTFILTGWKHYTAIGFMPYISYRISANKTMGVNCTVSNQVTGLVKKMHFNSIQEAVDNMNHFEEVSVLVAIAEWKKRNKVKSLFMTKKMISRRIRRKNKWEH